MSVDCLYVDFDGVVHGGDATQYCNPPGSRPYRRYKIFQYVPILEELVEPYPDLKIVLSTFWVPNFGFDRAKSSLKPSLAARVVGATYDHELMDFREFDAKPRHQQILEDVARRVPVRWLAIDDAFGANVPPWAEPHFVTADSEMGLGSATTIADLRNRLLVAFGSTGSQLITRTLGVCGGRPCIAGHRLDVRHVVGLLKRGESRKRITQAYDFITYEHLDEIEKNWMHLDIEES